MHRGRGHNRTAMKQRTPAICLRTSDYSETSQVVLFFTREAGAVRMLAKGAKRSKSTTGGAIDLLAEGELVFIAPREGSLGTLTEFAESSVHLGLRRCAVCLNAALYMVELVGALMGEGDPHPEAFDLLHNALSRLDQPDAPALAVLAYFQWRLLRHAGLLGRFEQCVACGAKISGEWEAYFSSQLGGLLCPQCEVSEGEKYRLAEGELAALKALSAAAAGRRVHLPDKQARAVNRLLAYHVQNQLGRAMKMARHAIG